jgi:hypothetical protein
VKAGEIRMKSGKMKVFGSVLTTSLIVAAFTTLLMTTSAPALVVVAKPGPPGTYEIDVYEDASGLHMICEVVHHFKASNLEWSTSIPSYPSGSVSFALDVRNVDFDKVNAWIYHLSLRGMEEGSIIAIGSTSFILAVKARSGELDFTFSNPSTYYPYYYRTVDIGGTLKGDVLFHIDVPPSIPEFNYEGRELTISVHIGM